MDAFSPAVQDVPARREDLVAEILRLKRARGAGLERFQVACIHVTVTVVVAGEKWHELVRSHVDDGWRGAAGVRGARIPRSNILGRGRRG